MGRWKFPVLAVTGFALLAATVALTAVAGQRTETSNWWPATITAGLSLILLLSALLVRGQARVALQSKAKELRRNPLNVPGSRHFASMLAYGDFVLPEGQTIRCEAIPGISGVITSAQVQTTQDGRPRVDLTRILTHFHFDSPSVVIEQHHSRASTGELIGGGAALLPGRASFSQFLILTLNGMPLCNKEPLVMTAERVEEWPPVGSSFLSERPTDFYELARIDDPDAQPFATLAACKADIVDQFFMPAQQEALGRPAT